MTDSHCAITAVVFCRRRNRNEWVWSPIKCCHIQFQLLCEHIHLLLWNPFTAAKRTVIVVQCERALTQIQIQFVHSDTQFEHLLTLSCNELTNQGPRTNQTLYAELLSMRHSEILATFNEHYQTVLEMQFYSTQRYSYSTVCCILHYAQTWRKET